MKFKHCLILLVVLLSAPLYGENDVLGVPGIQGVDVEISLPGMVRSITESAFLKTGKYKVIAYNDMEAILESQMLSLSGAFDDETAAEIGNIIAAKFIVHGEIVGFGGSFLLSLRIIEVESGNTEKAEIQKINGMNELDRKIHELVYRMADMVYHPDIQADRNIDALTIDDLNNNMIEIVPYGEEAAGFHISRYELTQGQWEEVSSVNPSHFTDELFPVESLTWYQAVDFCNLLSEKEGLEPVYRKDDRGRFFWDEWKNGYRLPTIDEWRTAARSGNPDSGEELPGSLYPDMIAWFEDNANSQTHTVGQKVANDAGIYDMAGNVAEICWAKGFEIREYLSPVYDRYPFLGGSYLQPPRELSIDWISSVQTKEKDKGSSGSGIRLVRSSESMLQAAMVRHMEREEILQTRRGRFEAVLERWDMVEILAPGESITFTMGSNGLFTSSDQKPKHDVTLTKPFSISRYELTIGDFIDIINYASLLGLVEVWSGNDEMVLSFPLGEEKYKDINGINFSDADNPYLGFSWNPWSMELSHNRDISNAMPLRRWILGALLCNLLSELTGRDPFYIIEDRTEIRFDFSANGFRYPFESEWELAARGGRELSRQKYAGSNSLESVAESKPSSFYNHWIWETGITQPNSLGIHDMSGTLGEYVNDRFYDYPSGSVTNPIGLFPRDTRIEGYTNLYSRTRLIVKGQTISSYGDGDENKTRQISYRVEFGASDLDFASLRPVYGSE